jgi:hypothetical protein
LHQVGLPEADHPMTMIVKPAPWFTLIYHFAGYAVIFAAYAGLTLWFQRALRTNTTNHDHAA